MLIQPERLGCYTSASRDRPGSGSQARPWEILSEANKSLRVTRIQPLILVAQPTEYRFPILRKTFLEQGVGSGLRSVFHWIKTPYHFCDREEAGYLLQEKEKSQTKGQRGKWQMDFRWKDSCEPSCGSFWHLPCYSPASSTPAKKLFPNGKAKLARASNPAHGQGQP